MKDRVLSPGFPRLGSLFSSLTSLLFPLLLLLSCSGLSSGCSSGSDGDAPESDPSPSGLVLCPCTADVYLDAWTRDENMGRETRLLLAPSTNLSEGLARGLFKFDMPEHLTASKAENAQIFLSACSHCGTADGGRQAPPSPRRV